MREISGMLGEIVPTIKGVELTTVIEGFKRVVVTNLPPRYPEPTAQIIPFPTQETQPTE